MEDLAQPGGDGAKLGPRDARRQLNGLQALGDELPRAVDARVVVEGGHDLREAELGDRADVIEPGQAADGQFDGNGDLLSRLPAG